VGIFGQAFDQNGNLWITNCNVTNPLSVKINDGTWKSFNFSNLGLGANPTIGQIIINQYNQKWMVLPRGGGILVFDENGTWSTGDDKMKKLNAGIGNGNLPSNEIECLAEDKDGEIWVGTDKGIAVFYCPDQVFSASGCEAQQIFIEQDGHTQLLLETEVVTCIAVDGANRKWIGTMNSGVYLMSADGTSQIDHFTVDNSPLLSNEIRSIVIHPKTGEVFFGTAEGIISYRNDATEGLEDYTDVYVFPNPVQPGYEGPIAITGLVENANVKITDISGGLVYQTKSLGGQAIWYGKNFKGEKAHSGVYLVFCSNDDGSKTYVTKILLVN
jgi:ligand-binding sensor domain-containing protein